MTFKEKFLEEFEKNKQILLDTKNEIDNLEISVNRLEIYKNILTRIDMLDRELKSKSKFILKLPVNNNFIDTFIPRAINGDRFEDVDKLVDALKNSEDIFKIVI